MEIPDIFENLDGPPTVLNSQPTTNNTRMTSTDSRRNYSSVASSTPPKLFPKKEQGIILGVIDGLKLCDYVTAVGTIIGPKNILFVSRVSNNRISMYLSSKNIVDNFVNRHPSIIVQNQNVAVRRLITPSRRIILSNVCPTIPHYILEDYIRNLGLKPASSITFLRAGIPGEQYNHILSFRRQIYVSPDDNINLPSNILINYENLDYRIFLTYDELICFSCKASGHIARDCPSIQSSSAALFNDAPNTVTSNSLTDSNPVSNFSNTEPNPQAMDMQVEPSVSLIECVSNQGPQPAENSELNEPLIPITQETTNKIHKRPAPSVVSESTILEDIQSSSQLSESDSIFSKPQFNKSIRQSNKKLKRSQSTESNPSIRELLEPVRNIVEEKSSSVLNFNQLVLFLENTHGNPDPLSVAQEFTKEIPQLLDFLRSLHDHLPSRLKTKCTRLQTKILKQLGSNHGPLTTDSSDTDAEPSQQGYM